MALDKRIAALGETPTQRFILQCLAALVVAIVGAPALEEIIGEYAPKGTDHRERIAGRPFIYYRGKTRANLEDEGLTPEQVQQVIDAHHARGLAFDDEAAPNADSENATTAASTGSGTEYQDAAKTPDTGPGTPGSPATAAAPTAPAGSASASTAAAGRPAASPAATGTIAPAAEPIVAGRKLSEFAGKTDDELLKMPNVGPATVKAIRDAQKTEAQRIDAQKVADAKAPKK
jgi:hypothetical protein